ncbi:hypothetical protein J3F83DRAFT_2755 [Trichoderma novae-zelandiae]
MHVFVHVHGQVHSLRPQFLRIRWPSGRPRDPSVRLDAYPHVASGTQYGPAQTGGLVPFWAWSASAALSPFFPSLTILCSSSSTLTSCDMDHSLVFVLRSSSRPHLAASGLAAAGIPGPARPRSRPSWCKGLLFCFCSSLFPVAWPVRSFDSFDSARILSLARRPLLGSADLILPCHRPWLSLELAAVPVCLLAWTREHGLSASGAPPCQRA